MWPSSLRGAGFGAWFGVGAQQLLTVSVHLFFFFFFDALKIYRSVAKMSFLVNVFKEKDVKLCACINIYFRKSAVKLHAVSYPFHHQFLKHECNTGCALQIAFEKLFLSAGISLYL